jgi:hypothetical protein
MVADAIQPTKGFQEPIIATTKGYMGLDKDDNSFNTELETLIGGAIGELVMQGVVVKEDFDLSESWIVVFPELLKMHSTLHMVREYIALYTKIGFDPPLPKTLAMMEKRLDRLDYLLQAAMSKLHEEDGTDGQQPTSNP